MKAGARIDARDEDGATPLFFANVESAKALIAAGADAMVRDREGNVPLHRNANPELLAPGVNVRNTAGLTPLHYAALAGNLDAVTWLLGQGADAKAQNNNRDTVAFRLGVQSLWAGRADTRAQYGTGSGPITASTIAI